MKCSTMNLVPLFALLFAVIGRGSANGPSQSISQSEKNEFKDLMPEFKQRLLRWMDAKKRDRQLKGTDGFDATYLDCTLCKTSVDSVRFFLGLHMDGTVVSLIRNFCVIFHIETASVCTGIVAAFKVSKFTVDFEELASFSTKRPAGAASQERPLGLMAFKLPDKMRPKVAAHSKILSVQLNCFFLCGTFFRIILIVGQARAIFCVFKFRSSALPANALRVTMFAVHFGQFFFPRKNFLVRWTGEWNAFSGQSASSTRWMASSKLPFWLYS